MKKLIIFPMIMLMFFSINIVNVNAQPKEFKQGIYRARDIGITIGTPVTARLTSPNDKAIIQIIDSDQTIEALVRLNSQINQQVLPPLNYDSSIVILTNGTVSLQ